MSQRLSPVPSLFLVTVLAVACASPPTATPPVVTAPAATDSERAADPAARLDEIAEAWFEEQLRLDPIFATSIGDHRYDDVFPVTISASWRARAKASDERFLEQVKTIDPAALDRQDRLTYEVLRREIETSVAGYEYPSHLLPVNQFFSTPNLFAMLGSGTSIQPFATVEDYEEFLGRVDGFSDWVDAAIGNMRQGVERGIVQPRALMEKVLPQLAAHLVDAPEESLFWGPIRSFPETIPTDERERLTELYRTAIRDEIVPAYRRLHGFVADEYLPHTRDTAGLGALPGGEEWYRYLVGRTTTTAMTPEEIHEVGLAEVARIHDEMRGVMATLGIAGSLQDLFAHMQSEPSLFFTSQEDLLASYRALQAEVDASTDRLFDLKPTTTYEIRPVEPFRERSASSGSYQAASPDGSRPGVFYVNTYDLKARPRTAMTSLLLHEGSPGHHFQVMIQRELEGLPRLRRFVDSTAYVEGWGLYAESLGDELGLYDDPYQLYGALEAELWRAIRLVLDTGIHAKGWSREQAIDYARKNSALGDTRIVSEVERFMAIPSQALAYKIGQLKIAELRARAERALGDAFDVKAFHRQILVDGSLPLDVLERKIDRWIAEQTSRD